MAIADEHFQLMISISNFRVEVGNAD